MLPDALAHVLALPDEARVIDVGGWAAPVNRADWVIDAMPYETRGAMIPGGFGPGPERFNANTWIVADICSAPWPFEDKFFDFAICTFTLEDVRDPITVCQEMSRIARAGYIEVPSLLDELTWKNPEVSGGPWVGHAHHRWLCTLEDGELVFLTKFHSLHARRSVRVPARWARQLSVADRMLTHLWEGELPARERHPLDAYPFEELEQAIRDRFGSVPLEARADHARDRAVRLLRQGAARALARLRS